jgi:excinuclease ABC subunit C
MIFAGEDEIFPILRAAGCLRYEIGSCLGPCVAACSRPAYAAKVQAVRAFLEGREDGPLEELDRRMAAAAAGLAFEHAAALRDQLEVLRWLRAQLERLREARDRLSFIYPVRGGDGQELWYLIHQGSVAAVIPAPAHGTSCPATRDRIEAVFEKKSVRAESRGVEEPEFVLLVAAWFRRYPEERSRTLPPTLPVAAGSHEMA